MLRQSVGAVQFVGHALASHQQQRGFATLKDISLRCVLSFNMLLFDQAQHIQIEVSQEHPENYQVDEDGRRRQICQS